MVKAGLKFQCLIENKKRQDKRLRGADTRFSCLCDHEGCLRMGN